MFAVAVAVDVALQLCFSLLLHLRGGADSKGKGSKGLFKSNSRVPRCHGGVQRGQARLLRVLIAITRDVVVDFSSIANRFNGKRCTTSCGLLEVYMVSLSCVVATLLRHIAHLLP